MIRKACHKIIHAYYSRERANFAKDLNFLERTQRKNLKRIVENLKLTEFWTRAPENYENFADQIPVRAYSDFEGFIKQQKESKEKLISPDIVRYEPTSGSTQTRKWIPYSKAFLAELNLAAAAWLGDTYRNYPGVRRGTHYWSLSYLPQELRELTSSDDAELFPFYQRWLLKKIMAVPGEIARLPEAELAWRASLISLSSRMDLTLVSVWSPTFWLKLTDDIRQNWKQIEKNLNEGTWGFDSTVLGSAPKRKIHLDSNDPEFFEKLWPKLTLISAWDSSSSHTWAQQIKRNFSKVKFQGKGLWATEGVLSIPFQEKKPLSLHSHFYEFRDLETGLIIPAWKLIKGRDYQPIISTSGGLLRYELQDRIRVIDFMEQTPCFEFIGRIQSVDLVGEKVDAAWVQALFQAHPQWKALCLVGIRKPHPHYILFHESDEQPNIESKLSTVHHYQVAREIGQLQAARSKRIESVFNFLDVIGKSEVAGQNKIEVLLERDSLFVPT